MFPAASLLLDYDSGGSAATDQSATWRMTTASNDPASITSALVVQLVQSGGSGSPTASLFVDFSGDGVEWTPGVVYSTNGSTTSVYSAGAAYIFGWVRVRLVVAGSTAPSVVASVLLGNSGAVKVTAVL